MAFAVERGQLKRDGRPWLATGFNYHPSGAGCRYWSDWHQNAIEADLAAMAARGFNTVRFFLFWREFEPTAARYDRTRLDRLRALVAAAERHGLACLPSLLTIWMNGQLFDLPWRNGRSLWRDPEMVEREVAYVATVARTLADFDNVLAYDLGDEIVHVDIAESSALTAREASAWQARLADAIRAEHPGALVMQANDLSIAIRPHPFGTARSTALDLVGVHGFPVWSPFAIESIDSYKGSSLVPFLVALTRADALPLVDEIGSYGADDDVAAGNMRAATSAAFAAGAAGALAWCWQDIADRHKPYELRPGERTAGLTTLDGRPKPALHAFEAVAARWTTWSAMRAAPASVAIYLPSAPLADENDPDGVPPDAFGAFYAYLLLKRAHIAVEFARNQLERYRLVLCPCVSRLTQTDADLLADYVAAGGVVYWSPGEHLHGFGGEHLLGVRLRDFTLDGARRSRFAWRGVEYPLEGAREVLWPVVRPAGAEVLARFPDGDPALTVNRLGAGRAYHLSAPFERLLDVPGRLTIRPWEALYRELAGDAGVRPEVTCTSPDVELQLLEDDGQRLCVAINHAPTHVVTTLAGEALAGGAAPRLKLAPKGVGTLALPGAVRDEAPVVGVAQ